MPKLIYYNLKFFAAIDSNYSVSFLKAFCVFCCSISLSWGHSIDRDYGKCLKRILEEEDFFSTFLSCSQPCHAIVASLIVYCVIAFFVCVLFLHRPDVPIEDVFMTEISYNDLTTFPSFEETLQRIPRSQLKTSVPKNVSPSLEQLNLRFNSQKLTGLESLKPGYKFPHYSQLTEGLVKYYIFLHSQYGTKGKRVSTEKDAAQYKQWTVGGKTPICSSVL